MYGGTKSEMERLLADAEKFSGVHYDIDNLNDVYQAIHVVQTELDITGTTAKEAASTIQGSTAMMKAAWSNLLVGLADDNADFSTLIGNFVDSATNTVKLIMPRITQALSGIGDLIIGVVPIITDALPELIDTALPPLIDATKSLLKGVADAIPSILITAIQELPDLVDAALEILLALADGLTQNLPALIPALMGTIAEIEKRLTEPESLVQMIDAALQLILALAQGIIDAIPQLIEAAPVIIGNLVKAIIAAFPQIISAGVQLIGSLVKGIGSAFSALGSVGRDIVSKVGDAIKGALKGALNWGKDLVSNFIDGIKQGWQNLKKGVSDVAAGIAGFFHHSVPKYGPFKDELTWMPDFMQNMADGIRDNAYLVTDEMDKAFNFDSGIITGSPEITATVSGTSATDSLLNQILSALGEMGVYIDGEKAGRLMAKGANVGMGQAYISTARRALA